MNPFVWVLTDSDGDTTDAVADCAEMTTERAWETFEIRNGGILRVDDLKNSGHRVTRCKLVEVGPA